MSVNVKTVALGCAVLGAATAVATRRMVLFLLCGGRPWKL